jgi:hypothetical protein
MDSAKADDLAAAALRFSLDTPPMRVLMRTRSDAASVRFRHKPKRTSLGILADSEVVSGMDYGAVKLDHSLKSARHVIDNEIRQR